MNKSKAKFPCNNCGKCCRKVNMSEETIYLDRGDGICKNFDEKTNLCLIYRQRPLICRVEDYYKKNLSKNIEWNEFVKINIKICEQL